MKAVEPQGKFLLILRLITKRSAESSPSCNQVDQLLIPLNIFQAECASI